jgi:hypothetical protein
MTIDVHDPVLVERIRKQVAATESQTLEEALSKLLETQEEQDRWLLDAKDHINRKIERGLEQLDRGEGIPDDQLDAYLSALKSKVR